AGLAHGELLADAFAREARHLGLDPPLHEAVVARADRRVLAPPLRHETDLAGLAIGARADGDALVVQRRRGDPPSLTDVADAIGVGDAHAGEEHLVELGLAGDLAQGAHLDARV